MDLDNLIGKSRVNFMPFSRHLPHLTKTNAAKNTKKKTTKTQTTMTMTTTVHSCQFYDHFMTQKFQTNDTDYCKMIIKYEIINNWNECGAHSRHTGQPWQHTEKENAERIGIRLIIIIIVVAERALVIDWLFQWKYVHELYRFDEVLLLRLPGSKRGERAFFFLVSRVQK